MERTAGGRPSGAGAEFTQYFRSLVSALGDGPGWYGVYARRDPDGARAYTDGTDLPPWDVVRALLHDVAALHGVMVDPGIAERAQRLLRAATAEADTGPGSDEALRVRLGTTLRERQWAMTRERDADNATRQGPYDGSEADRLANDLAWARDDRERAAAARWEDTPTDAPRGARFAGVAHGTRAAAAAAADDERRRQQDQRTEEWREEARQEMDRLGLLRRSGNTGEVYLMMCEAAAGHAGRLPVFAAELERRGFSADVATLLWEVSSQPPDGVAAAAAALAGSGREHDCRTLLNQAAARPAIDVAEIASALLASAHRSEAEELLTALARARMPEDAVQVVRERIELARPLLAAAGRVSASRRRDVARRTAP